MSVKKLLEPPLVQLALDTPSVPFVRSILRQIPNVEELIIEAGTPLIKKYGLSVIREIHKEMENAFVIADLKTLDVGRVEARLAYEESADGAVVSGLAPRQTIEEFLSESKDLNMWGIIDMMAVYDPLKVLTSLDILPDVIILHRGIDEELQRTLSLPLIRLIKKKVRGRILVGVAGGVSPITAKTALKKGADIIIVGRYVTASTDPRRSIGEVLSLVRQRHE